MYFLRSVTICLFFHFSAEHFITSRLSPGEQTTTIHRRARKELIKRYRMQGGRSCTGARVAPAKKFGLRRKFLARIYAILSRIKICRDTHFLEIFGQKKCLFGSKTVFLGQEVHQYMVYIAYFYMRLRAKTSRKL